MMSPESPCRLTRIMVWGHKGSVPRGRGYVPMDHGRKHPALVGSMTRGRWMSARASRRGSSVRPEGGFRARRWIGRVADPPSRTELPVNASHRASRVTVGVGDHPRRRLCGPRGDRAGAPGRTGDASCLRAAVLDIAPRSWGTPDGRPRGARRRRPDLRRLGRRHHLRRHARLRRFSDRLGAVLA